jgi:hypothetical protein
MCRSSCKQIFGRSSPPEHQIPGTNCPTNLTSTATERRTQRCRQKHRPSPCQRFCGLTHDIPLRSQSRRECWAAFVRARAFRKDDTRATTRSHHQARHHRSCGARVAEFRSRSPPKAHCILGLHRKYSNIRTGKRWRGLSRALTDARTISRVQTKKKTSMSVGVLLRLVVLWFAAPVCLSRPSTVECVARSP